MHCRSCRSQTSATSSYASRNQSQFAIEGNSVDSAISFIGYASGGIGVSGNSEDGFVTVAQTILSATTALADTIVCLTHLLPCSEPRKSRKFPSEHNCGN